MDKKTKIFFTVFFTLIAAVVIITFMKYFVAKDYYIQAQADCDPTTEKCFIWNCDPKSTVEGEKCTGDPENDIWYYKNVKKIANQIPECNPNDENCQALLCTKGMDCEETLCDESNKGSEECNDSVKYNEENPPEDDSVEECAPDDQECLDSASSAEECAPGDEECTSSEEADTECESDDQECLDAASADESEAADAQTDTSEGQTKKINNPADGVKDSAKKPTI